MEFEINFLTKQKAKKRRLKNEGKWKIPNVIAFVLMIVGLLLLIINIVHISFESFFVFHASMIVGIVLFLFGVILRTFTSNVSNHWIYDRLNERIWIENGTLTHFTQTAFSSGINSYHADSSAYVFLIELSSIRNARYDPNSGRIEFNASGKGVHYSDYPRNIIDNEWFLPSKFTAVFYDYTNPSLYEYLKSIGVIFAEQTIEFKIRDGRI